MEEGVMTKPLFKRITEQIVADLERGVAPWVKPWTGSTDPVPHNATSGRHYRGINHLLLGMRCYADGYTTNGWLTYRQAQTLGGRVRRGEQGTTVIYYQPVEDEPEDSVGSVSRSRALLRAFTVFNLDQTEGLEGLRPDNTDEIPWEPYAEAERVMDQSGADIRHQGDKAFYAPGSDRIVLPIRSVFDTADGYYATALHELAHWTGHKSRLDRDFTGRFGTEAYAVEELIAEISAAFLCDHCRIPSRLQHSAYIASWLKVLNNDHRAIFNAASHAQKAADYLLAPADQSPQATLNAA
jgi:antirestriction protein ArdC